ncbi:hypothetical protein BDA99DRAFT_509986 [Phascolomyces articulosus]|uniref:Uncharacterized protein n=1 Tax=Phascolomyces articulosus TaxID=60185 RepID=A0AAD5PEB8_9FUNG|nr:hypothetical protein BDA99DRAFT_509986 [Phascolomyces articulosus]
MIGPFFFCLAFFSMMYNGSYYQDIRLFRGLFITVLASYVVVTIGLIITVVLSFTSYSSGGMARTIYIQYSITVRLAGSLALAIIVIMFPKSWLQSMREYEIRNEMPPAHLQYEGDQNQTWNPNLQYDPNPNQGYVNIDQ